MEQTVEFAHATGALSGIWLLVAIPLASAAILLLLGKRADKWGHWLGVLAVAASFVLGLVFFFSLRASTQMWFLIWNAIGLVIYFVWSSRNSRLAKGEEQAG